MCSPDSAEQRLVDSGGGAVVNVLHQDLLLYIVIPIVCHLQS